MVGKREGGEKTPCIYDRQWVSVGMFLQRKIGFKIQAVVDEM